MSIFKTQQEIEELELYQDLVERFAVFLSLERQWVGEKYYKKPKYLKDLEKRIEDDIAKNIMKKHSRLWDSYEVDNYCYFDTTSRWENKYNTLSYKHPWE